MSPERVLPQLRAAIDKRFDRFTRNWSPDEKSIPRVKTRFTQTVLDVYAVTGIDGFLTLAEEADSLLPGLNYRNQLHAKFTSTRNAQPGYLPQHRKTEEETISNLKPEVAEKLAKARLQELNPQRQGELAQECMMTTYDLIEGKLIVDETNTGQYL